MDSSTRTVEKILPVPTTVWVDKVVKEGRVQFDMSLEEGRILYELLHHVDGDGRWYRLLAQMRQCANSAALYECIIVDGSSHYAMAMTGRVQVQDKLSGKP